MFPNKNTPSSRVKATEGQILELQSRLLESMLYPLRVKTDVFPCAIVGRVTSSEKRVFKLKLSNWMEYRDARAALVQLADVQGLEYLCMVTEGWMLPEEDEPRAAELVAFFGHISQVPSAIEVLIFSLETYYGAWLAKAQLVPSGGVVGQRTYKELPVFNLVESASTLFGDEVPAEDGLGSVTVR